MLYNHRNHSSGTWITEKYQIKYVLCLKFAICLYNEFQTYARSYVQSYSWSRTLIRKGPLNSRRKAVLKKFHMISTSRHVRRVWQLKCEILVSGRVVLAVIASWMISVGIPHLLISVRYWLKMLLDCTHFSHHIMYLLLVRCCVHVHYGWDVLLLNSYVVCDITGIEDTTISWIIVGIWCHSGCW